MTELEMDNLTRDLPTKSAKIRALAERGVSRADIANYLKIRYQHVRNVLVAPPPAARASGLKEQASGAPGTTKALSIDEAKRGLAAQFGVPTSAIEITIRG